MFPKIKKAADGCNAIPQPELSKHPKDGGAIPIHSRLALTQADTRQTTLWRHGDHQPVNEWGAFPIKPSCSRYHRLLESKSTARPTVAVLDTVSGQPGPLPCVPFTQCLCLKRISWELLIWSSDQLNKDYLVYKT